ncbi:tyrosine-protein phosphatase [Glycomyces luteolus]|uniref:Tyrosine-protein phosphatase n=1 Tax=Glycomyces luteolus TaxID=2670330 RepID=A0A9X3SS45_9ACTN|nr:tyrosine-protein phosphatase [Glycomyces luteolus]MDA1360764.1 tyrosine-protein phosphatase [Glycomyces luteolus]
MGMEITALETLPPQFIPTVNVFNLRDIGGWNARDGKKVKTGQVFRSDNFGNATEADIDHVVNHLGVKHVIDLRRAEEWDESARFPDLDGVDFHHFEMLHIKWEQIGLRVNGLSDEAELIEFLRHRYTGMMESGYLSVRDSLEVIASGEPVVFHCMAGKDRTGIIAAVLLSILGVDDEDIAADYALTSFGSARWRAWRDENFGKPEVESGLATPAEAMLQTIREINARFGSMERYAEATGFKGADALRDLLLQ